MKVKNIISDKYVRCPLENKMYEVDHETGVCPACGEFHTLIKLCDIPEDDE